MSMRPKKIEVLRLWLLTAVCSGALLSPAWAAQVDYFKPAPPQVPPASNPTTQLPAIQKGAVPQFDKSTPKVMQPSTKGGHAGAPPSGIVGPNQAPAGTAKGKVFPKVEIHAMPPAQMPSPPGKPQFEFTIQNKAQPAATPGVEPPPPGSAGETMQKVRGGEAMNKATPVLMIPGAAETPPPEKAGEVVRRVGPGSAEEKGIIIINGKPGEGAAGDTVPTESLSLNYGKVKTDYAPQGQGGNVETEFKVEKGE